MQDLTDKIAIGFDYQNWVNYFEENSKHRLQIDFSDEPVLTQSERRLIFPSIKAFQKGESSDGVYLLKSVDDFVQSTGFGDYRTAMELFIKEENVHSAYLGEYMDFHIVAPDASNSVDDAFRRLRKAGGLKREVTVLVTAEIIALSYYDALSRCVQSSALKSICDQMLHDEIPHVIFQSYTLGHLAPTRSDATTRAAFMRATTDLVWAAYGDVFRAGGYTSSSLMGENLGYLRQSIELASAYSQM